MYRVKLNFVDKQSRTAPVHLQYGPKQMYFSPKRPDILAPAPAGRCVMAAIASFLLFRDGDMSLEYIPIKRIF